MFAFEPDYEDPDDRYWLGLISRGGSKSIKKDISKKMDKKSGSGKNKYASIDRIRVLAFLFIIVYHFMVQLERNGNYDFLKKGLVYYENANLHIAMVGVSLFFMISGAGLMLSSRKSWNIRDFYKRRFIRLLIPFYIVELFTLIASYVMKPEWLEYFPAVPKIRIILNFLGMDGYFEQFFQTFSLHVGEWFLGALIMLYAVFPLLRFCMEKNRYITVIAATAGYSALIFGNVFSAPWTNVFVKAYDFILGMFLILELPKLMEKKTARYSILAVSLAVIFIGIVLKVQLPTQPVFNSLICAVMIFAGAFALEPAGESDNVFDRAVKWICGISYELFLVHHIIIYYIGDNLGGRLLNLRRIGVLFIAEAFIMLAMALFVKKIEKLIRLK